MQATPRVGFIGAGRMATALAGGWLAAGLASRETLLASDPLPAAAAEFARITGCRTTPDNRAVAEAADVLVLAVKPQQVGPVLEGLHGKPVAGKLVVSIAAGVPLARLTSGLGPAARLV